MNKNPRNLLWAIPLALFITSPLWKPAVASFLKPRGDFATTHSTIASQHFQMDGIAITLTSNGKEEWLITSERAQTGANDREILMEVVQAKYIGKERPPTNINSQRGQYFINDRHLILIDDVVIKKPLTNEVMYTDRLHYYDETKMAVSPDDVELQGPKFHLQAGRMDYDLSTNGYDFGDRVKVRL